MASLAGSAKPWYGIFRRNLRHRDGPFGKLVRVRGGGGRDAGDPLADEHASAISSLSDDSVALDLAEPHGNLRRTAAHGDRVGSVGACLLGGFDQSGDAVDKLGGIDAG